MIDLEPIKTRTNAATEGPWEWEDLSSLKVKGSDEIIIWTDNVLESPSNWSEALGSCGINSEKDAEANAQFIAHARKDVPDLIDEVEQLRELLAELVDDDLCFFSSDGMCQAHGVIGYGTCPHKEAKEYLQCLTS